MPTIRIDDDVFEGLKKLAEPFVDSPNSVVRRLLIEKGILVESEAKTRPPPAPRPTVDRALTSKLTPQQVYEQFLLVTLERDFGGSADKRSVTQSVIELMVKQGFIGPANLEV